MVFLRPKTWFACFKMADNVSGAPIAVQPRSVGQAVG